MQALHWSNASPNNINSLLNELWNGTLFPKVNITFAYFEKNVVSPKVEIGERNFI